MKKLVFLFTVLILSLFVTASAQEPLPAIYVDMNEVGGLTPEGKIPQSGTDLTIPIRFYNVDENRTAISNGYYFHSSDVTVGNMRVLWNCYYPFIDMCCWIWPCPPGSWFDQGHWETPLTKGLGGIGMVGLTGEFGEGLPADFHDVAYTFTVTDVNGPPGSVLTMDTTYWEPGNYWLWGGVSGFLEDVYWGGPYEWVVQLDCGTPPTITSTPPTGPFNEGDAFYYDVEVSSCGIVEFSLTGAPTGMSISPVTGEINWTCAEGVHSFTVVASNGINPDTEQYYEFMVYPNIPPGIIPIPDQYVMLGEHFTYDVEVTEGLTNIVFFLDTSPSGMTIDPVSGVIDWTPYDEGVFVVTVMATDGILADYESFQILVESGMIPPIFTNLPSNPSEAQTGTLWTFDVDAVGWPLPVISLTVFPEGMTIDENGVISWTPGPGQAGPIDVTVVASNGVEPDASYGFVINVVPLPMPPIIAEIDDQVASMGDVFAYNVEILSGFPYPEFTVDGPPGMTIHPISGLIEWAVDRLGPNLVTVTATNGWGSDDESFTITVSDCEPSTTCYPQPVYLGINDNDRVLEVTVYCENVASVDLASVRILDNIPCYTNDGVAYDNGDGSFTTDAFLMRFLGSGGFRPLDPNGIVSTYWVSYMKGTQEITLVGDFLMNISCCDVTFDGSVGLDDVIFMTEHLFGGGPRCELDGYPMDECMDVDQSGRFDLLDIRALIEIVY